MILVDSSIWIDHFRAGDDRLARLLGEGRVVAHPFVTGELALGNLRHRDAVLGALQDLPQACVATETKVPHFIGEKGFFGIDIGYIDAHLLAATLLTPGSWPWTRNKRPFTASVRLGIAANTAQHNTTQHSTLTALANSRK